MTDPIPQAEIEKKVQRSEPKPRDPMAMSIWTLGQAVTWIVFRTPEKVREYWDFSLADMMLDAAVHEPEASVTTAIEELFARLAEGALTAIAINDETGPEPIPAEKWRYIVHTADGDLADRLWFKTSSKNVQYLKTQYRDITLKRGDVCRLWEDASFRAIPANKGGRPPAADWDAYYEKFLEEVKARGFPDKLNDDGWRRQVDVANWLTNLAEKEGYSPGTSTLRQKAREFLAKAKLETGSDLF